jgi:Rieske Fe-S protein
MKRRDFVKICAASGAGAAWTELAQGAPLPARSYARAKLVDDKGAPIRIGDLAVGRNYVFDYPYEATPCFLLRLDRAAPGGVELRTQSGGAYRWEGGIGADKSVVAYSAICAHKMAYPTRQVSFIGYREGPSPVAGKGRVITCCSDRSVYDPAAGARVVSGPAPQPLCAILLEHDRNADEVHAVGTFGGEKFEEFFAKYSFRLELEMGRRAHAATESTTIVRPLERYSAQWARC